MTKNFGKMFGISIVRLLPFHLPALSAFIQKRVLQTVLRM